jgi:hypothetical protein
MDGGVDGDKTEGLNDRQKLVEDLKLRHFGTKLRADIPLAAGTCHEERSMTVGQLEECLGETIIRLQKLADSLNPGPSNVMSSQNLAIHDEPQPQVTIDARSFIQSRTSPLTQDQSTAEDLRLFKAC